MPNPAPGDETGLRCPACGTENRNTAGYCRQCGAKLAAAPAESATAAPIEAAAAAAIPAPAASTAASPAAAPSAAAGRFGGLGAGFRRRPLLIGGGGLAVALLIVAGLLLLGPGRDLLSPKVTEYANRDPTTVASSTGQSATMLGQLARGDRVMGHWFMAPGGQARWLKVRWGERGVGYVWGLDLSSQPRPDITPSDQGFQTASATSIVYVAPDASSKPVDRLNVGETARVIGVTRDEWAEIALRAGGVGYLPASALSSQAGDDASSAQPSGASGATHYVCTFAPDQSRDPPQPTGAIGFYFDEARNCLNHRYVYVADDVNGLRRVILNDSTQTASLLYFPPNRTLFYRTDYQLPPDAYAKVRQAAKALDSATCAPPGDARAVQALDSVLKNATPALDTQSQTYTWRRRVWQCQSK